MDKAKLLQDVSRTLLFLFFFQLLDLFSPIHLFLGTIFRRCQRQHWVPTKKKKTTTMEKRKMEIYFNWIPYIWNRNLTPLPLQGKEMEFGLELMSLLISHFFLSSFFDKYTHLFFITCFEGKSSPTDAKHTNSTAYSIHLSP